MLANERADAMLVAAMALFSPQSKKVDATTANEASSNKNNICSKDAILLASVTSIDAASKTWLPFQSQKKADVMDEDQFWKASEVVIETRIKCIMDFMTKIGYKGRVFDLMKDPSKANELRKVSEEAFEKACTRWGTTKDIYEISQKAYATSPQGQRKFGMLALKIRRKLRKEETNRDEEAQPNNYDSKEEEKIALEKGEILELAKMYVEAFDRCIEEFVGLTGDDIVDIFAILRDPTTGPYLQKEFHLAKMKLLEGRNVSLDVFHALLQKYSSEPELKVVVGIEQIIRQGSALSANAIELPDNTSLGMLLDKEVRIPAVHAPVEIHPQPLVPDIDLFMVIDFHF